MIMERVETNEIAVRIVMKKKERKESSFLGRAIMRTWSIRNLTTGCFLLSLILLGGVVILVCLLFAYRSVKNVTSNKSELVTTIVENFVEEWLGKSPTVLSVLEKYLLLRENEMDLYFDNPSDVEHLQLYMRNILEIWDDMFIIMYGTPTGTSVGAVNVPQAYPELPFLGTWSNESSMDNPCCNYTQSRHPDPIYARNVYPNNTLGPYFYYNLSPYDYRVIDNGWYPVAVSEENANSTYSWTTSMNKGGVLQTSIAKRIVDSAGVFRGVIMVGFGLSEFDWFFSDLLENKLRMGEMFVVERDSGLLLSNSLGEAIYREVSGTTDSVEQRVERQRAEDCGDETIRAVSRSILAEYGAWEVAETPHGTFLIDGKWMISVVRPDQDLDSLPVVFVYVMTKYEVYRQVVAAGAISSTVLVAVSALFVALCVVAIVLITRPLGALVNEMKKIEKMDLEEISLKKSALFEVRALQEAFLFSMSKLREIKKFLPLSLQTPHAESPGEEEEEEDEDEGAGEYEADSFVDYPLGDDEKEVPRQRQSKSTTSSDSNPSDCIVSQFGSPAYLMELKLRKRKRYIVKIHVVGLAEMLKEGHLFKDSVIRFSGAFFDLLIDLISTHCGAMLKYGLDTFVLTFRKSTNLMHFVEPFIRNANDLMHNFPLLKAKVGVFAGKCWLGNVGSQKLKKEIIWGRSYKFLSKFLSKYVPTKTVDVVVCDYTRRCIPRRYVTKPIHVFEYELDQRRKFVLFYRIGRILKTYDMAEDEYVELSCIASEFSFNFTFASEETWSNLESSLVRYVKRTLKRKKVDKDLEVSVFGFQKKKAISKLREFHKAREAAESEACGTKLE